MMSDKGRAAAASAELRSRLERVVTGNDQSAFGVPGAVFAVMTPDGTVMVEAQGVDGAGYEVTTESFMPIASASKLATGLLILRLAEEGALDLHAEIGAYLPEAEAAKTSGVTLKRMLSHTSGLAAEFRHELSMPRGVFRLREGMRWPNKAAAACLLEAPRVEPGTAVSYSNVAFGLLGLVADRVTGRPFADAIRSYVFEPLGLEAFIGELPPGRVMTVSDVPSPYIGTALEPYNSHTARLNGAPYSGVLTNAVGLLRLVRAYGVGSGLLSDKISALARTDHGIGLGGGFVSEEAFVAHVPPKPIEWSPCPWGLSIELQGGKLPHWAPHTMPDSFGQIGSSGCLAWHDPHTKVSWAFMGARTTHGGWLARHGVRIAQSAVSAAKVSLLPLEITNVKDRTGMQL
jgi:CubicO group peptidase (beta-lactamase class C family)